MIQFIFVIIIVLISAVYLYKKIKNAGDECNSSKCGSCRYHDNCDELKQDKT
ncbi:MAG: hypothetical protein L6407_07870 [Candidatus Delongbacteria bacterium]|nr:hypothetical protein [Candidatus Delongbacteria bacterium]